MGCLNVYDRKRGRQTMHAFLPFLRLFTQVAHIRMSSIYTLIFKIFILKIIKNNENLSLNVVVCLSSLIVPLINYALTHAVIVSNLIIVYYLWFTRCFFLCLHVETIFYLANFACFYPSKYKAFPPDRNYIFLILPYTK